MNKERHVIFLGAGASASSGYPVGDTLRLKLSSAKHFGEHLKDSFGGDSFHQYRPLMDYFDKFKSSIGLFRSGGFSTVDEFSKLASAFSTGDQMRHTQQMKKLMSLALAMHNPEESFEKSDYYPFTQRLFRDDDLHALRDYVTVLSYNYDCYFDYVLGQAYNHRKGLTRNKEPFHWNRFTSGFDNLPDTAWFDGPDGFRYYKLHGSMLTHGESDFRHLFEVVGVSERLNRLISAVQKDSTPRIVFPWELFDEADNFIREDEFVFVKDAPDQEQKSEGQKIYRLYKRIWAGARVAVERATKISFVGLSVHPYMEAGLRYLFKGKTGRNQVVVANRTNREFSDFKNPLHRSSLCGRVAKTLLKVAPGLQFISSFSEDDGSIDIEQFNRAKDGTWTAGITARDSFEDFIRAEMS